MSSSPNPADWGIFPGYHDIAGHWRETPPATAAALLATMGAGGQARPPGAGPGDDPVWTLRAGDRRPLDGGPWELVTEDGARLRPGDRLPPDLPLGYHRLEDASEGRSRLLVVSPGRCHLPAGLRSWGWAVQLYAARSRASWGIGDLADLRRLAHWSRGLGAGLLLVNPLHATVPSAPQASPYYPSSRCFRNPVYLRVEDVPGAAGAGLDLEALAAEGRALNGERRIDRERVWALKASALERLWERFSASGGAPGFDRYVAEGGVALAGFATHCVLAERLGGAWPGWPPEFRRPGGPAVGRFAAEHATQVGFHQWLQWLMEGQLAAAGEEVDVMSDLAIGVDPGGADAWLWQDCLALGARVGAPPDDFNTRGQDWSLPPFDPWRLRLAGYEPYVRTLRAGFRGAGGLRVDHVMGLFRLFWIPLGAAPVDGAYVGYRHDELLDILALESHRAGAYVVGEDLGTVEDRVRHELAEREVLSYRLLWFEPHPPPAFPSRALAAVTTHDLPTVAGLWSGTDVAEQRALGLEPNEEGAVAIRERLGRWAGLSGDETPAEAVIAAHALLARAPSMLLAATLEDALAVEERPNVPGTVEERPNWSLALPVPLEELEHSPTAAAVARALSR